MDDIMDFDNEFGLCDGESSDKECGEDLYAYLSEPVVSMSDVDALTRASVNERRAATKTTMLKVAFMT